MPMTDLARSLRRAHAAFERRPDAALHDDAAATATWLGGTACRTAHANGTRVETDLPASLGGAGRDVSPGWLLRASLASCTATTIVMAAADRNIELAELEVEATSRSDTRGLLGMADAQGSRVRCAPQDVCLRVRIRAAGVPSHALRALVEEACRRSPVPNAVTSALPIDLRVEALEG